MTSFYRFLQSTTGGKLLSRFLPHAVERGDEKSSHLHNHLQHADEQPIDIDTSDYHRCKRAPRSSRSAHPPRPVRATDPSSGTQRTRFSARGALEASSDSDLSNNTLARTAGRGGRFASKPCISATATKRSQAGSCTR